MTKEVIINDIPVQVTSNLDSALRHLRGKGYTCLWVDAICINQENKVEKSQQLLWISAIYRRAKEVAAWAGEESENSISAIEFINDERTSSAASGLGRLVFFPRTDLESVASFLGMPYWKRVWIIQELALAKSTTIHCGESSLSWLKLTQALESLDSSLSARSYQTRQSINLVANSDFINAKNLAKFHADAAKHKPLRFLQALRRSLSSEATEPRDRVFALLGLVCDSGLYIIAPNYRQRLEDGCLAITLSAISTTSCLDLIPMLASGYDNTSNLPSWVPNWFALDEASAHRQLYYITEGKWKDPEYSDNWYKASHGATPTASMSFAVLKVCGHLCDTIQWVSGTVSETECSGVATTFGQGLPNEKPNNPYVFDGLSDHHSQERSSLHAVITTLTRHMHLVPTPTQHRQRVVSIDLTIRALSDFWQKDMVLRKQSKRCTDRLKAAGNICLHGSTLKGLAETIINQDKESFFPGRVDSEPLDSSSVPEKGSEYGETSNSDIHTPHENLKDILMGVERTLEEEMRFLVTEKGYVGWAHPRAMKGDRICILKGCSVPAILRERKEGGYVVGDAYVEGIMEGEVVSFWQREGEG